MSDCLAPNLKTYHNIQVTTAVATGRLVGKPAVLRDICDAVGAEANGKLPTMNHSTAQHAPTLSTYRRGRFACLCSHRQRLQRNNVIFGSLVISHERVTEEHLPGCPASQILGCRDQSEKIGLTFTGLRRLLNSAIKLSFAIPSGAGGWSLSPSFTYFPTVNAKNRPSFQSNVPAWLRWVFTQETRDTGVVGNEVRSISGFRSPKIASRQEDVSSGSRRRKQVSDAPLG